MNRKFITKKDFIIFAGLAVLALIIYIAFLHSQRNADEIHVHVIRDGRDVKTLDISVDKVFSLEELPFVLFEIRDGAAAFIESDCPDKICVNKGFLNRPGQQAVCMPNRVSIVIRGEGAADVVIP